MENKQNALKTHDFAEAKIAAEKEAESEWNQSGIKAESERNQSGIKAES